jgi:ornithine decarboxylase
LSFYYFSKAKLLNNITQWFKLFPEISPYYAVKCNNYSKILEILSKNNFNFDCASKNEIKLVHKYNRDIIFANPIKSVPDIEYAKKKNIKLVTLDSDEELIKLNTYYPNCDYLLRINVDDSYSLCKLNLKFGHKYPNLFNINKHKYKPNFSGYAFHVGSNCSSSISYINAFELIQSLNDNPKIIDIGGGFSKQHNNMEEISDIVKYYKTKFINTKIIAEPGRYIVEDVMDLYVKVIGKSQNKIFINNSIYGDLNNITYDYKIPYFNIINDIDNKNENDNLYTYSIYGNTCDSLDIICKNILSPEINVNDTLCFPNMGAYSLVSRTSFNGIPVAKIINK